MAVIDGEQAFPSVTVAAAPIVDIMLGEKAIASFADGYDVGFADGYVDGFADGQAAIPPSSPPTLANLHPAAGTQVYPDTPLQFDIVDAEGFALTIPMISMDPFKVPEPTARGVSGADFEFEPLYAGSTRVAIANGYRYTLRRVGGWYATPSLRLWAIDARGAVWVGP